MSASKFTASHLHTPSPSRKLSPMSLAVLAALALPSWAAQAQQAAADGATAEVVVTGSVVARRVDAVPYAASVISADALRSAGPMINLSESLVQVPGMVANLRNNYAQDLQMSSRGFGARAGFGVRGLRLYSDGIPASGPDGQGQVSHFDLAGAQRVEVLRGPFSVLYGNSSGGVVAVFGAPVRQAEGEVALDAGSHGLRQLRGSVGTPLGQGFDVKVAASTMSVEGFRPHSSAERQTANARLGWTGEADQITVLLNHLNQPADDPLGLDRSQVDADPGQTTQQALDYDTRKTQVQTQAGASWRHRFGDGALRDSQLAVYKGRREVGQFLAIPPASQANARHGGGVVEFDRSFEGAEGRLRFAWTGIDLQIGAALDTQRDDRKGYENFTGSGADQLLGVRGALRRDEVNQARSRDLFGQAELELSPAWTASAGLRSGQVRLSADDAFLSNGDDSGRRDYRYTNPVVGLRWLALRDGERSLQWHASLARGTETPTLGELAYRPDGSGGFNGDLKPQTSRQGELGARWREAGLALDATLFRANVADEIATLTNARGRASFQNVGATRRQGLELSGRWQLSPTWHTQWALTRLDARYRDSFLACAGLPCNAPTVTVPAGNRIAGTQRSSAWAALAWRDASWGEWAAEVRSLGRTPVNDLNNDAAPGFALLGLRWQQQFALGAGRRLEVLARVDNLLDRQHIGSVIVNDANGRYFEPGAPRSLLLGLRLVGGL